MKKELPSGRKIFNPLAAAPVEPVVAEPLQESTSAMSHDADDQCPKCKRGMIPARASGNIEVLFCDQCRVSHPMRA